LSIASFVGKTSFINLLFAIPLLISRDGYARTIREKSPRTTKTAEK
jgi:hypothetical protein